MVLVLTLKKLFVAAAALITLITANYTHAGLIYYEEEDAGLALSTISTPSRGNNDYIWYAERRGRGRCLWIFVGRRGVLCGNPRLRF